MKKIMLLLLVMATMTAVAQYPVLKIGEKLPGSESMKDATSGKTIDLKSLPGENGLLLIFSCNTCPFVVAWEDRFHTINDIAKENKIGYALINSNFMNRGGVDSFEKMSEHAKSLNYKWPYLLDDESDLANAFGAQTTPHVFLFDKNMKLVYKGTIDDNHKDAAKVEAFYLKDALKSLANGKEITNKETRNIGCSIKRKTS